MATSSKPESSPQTRSSPQTKSSLQAKPSSQTSTTKHSLLVAGHQTSVSLEDAFWTALKQAAAGRGLAVAALVAEIDAGRGAANLSSAIRVHLLDTLTRDQ